MSTGITDSLLREDKSTREICPRLFLVDNLNLVITLRNQLF